MNYLYCKYNDYVIFIEKYKSDRIFKNLKIAASSKGGKLIKEIFNNPLYTSYKIEKYTPNLLVSFNTDKGFKYRLDIFRIIEKDKSIDYINHIAFSDYSNSTDDEDKYEELLKRNEMREILNRIHYILKDLIINNFINNYFCIGGTKLLSKNNIYEYMLKVLVGDSGFDKLSTDVYKTKFGLYFKI